MYCKQPGTCFQTTRTGLLLLMSTPKRAHECIETMPHPTSQTFSIAPCCGLQDLAADSLTRMGRRHDALRDVASRLSRGVVALQAHIAREAGFYTELAQLQRFWKVWKQTSNCQAVKTMDKIPCLSPEAAVAPGSGCSAGPAWGQQHLMLVRHTVQGIVTRHLAPGRMARSLKHDGHSLAFRRVLGSTDGQLATSAGLIHASACRSK